MRGPTKAEKAIDARDGGLPGVCKIGKKKLGLYIPYVIGPGGPQAFVKMEVRDPISGYTEMLRFLVDPGSTGTVIPRKLLADGFDPQRSRRKDHVSVETSTGESSGLKFRADLFLGSSKGPSVHIPFLKTLVVVVGNDFASDETHGQQPDGQKWNDDYAILGLNVIRKAVVVFDSTYVTFWKPGDEDEPYLFHDVGS